MNHGNLITFQLQQFGEGLRDMEIVFDQQDPFGSSHGRGMLCRWGSLQFACVHRFLAQPPGVLNTPLKLPGI